MAASCMHSIATEQDDICVASAASEPSWRAADSLWRRPSSQIAATEAAHVRPPIAPPAVLVCKCNSADVLSIDMQHNRQPDVGIGISVKLRPGTQHEIQEYYGEYIGHGLSKTAFLLRRSTRARTDRADATEHAAKYHGKVFKLAKKRDIEPEVCRQARALGVTTSILFEAEAMDTDTKQHYHCWITDRCIPLNQLCKQYGIIPSRCSIGAYFCLLRAIVGNLYISDCGFQNIGLVVDGNATEHSIVVIDVGHNQCTASAWSKSEVNWKVMKKFWEHCKKQGAEIPQLREHWQQHHTLREALRRANKEWQHIGATVTEEPLSSDSIAAAMSSRNEQVFWHAKDTPAYKIIKAVGQAVAGCVWSDDCVAQCYRASDTLCLNLSLEDEAEILELYSRLVNGKIPMDEKVQFWVQLDEFRRQQHGTDEVAKQDAEEMLNQFRKEVLSQELARDHGGYITASKHSILFTMLHNRAGYKHAAAAIMQYGLPQLLFPCGSEDLEQHMHILTQFASTMVRWLQKFAYSMRSLRGSEEYQKNRRNSARTLQERCSRRRY